MRLHPPTGVHSHHRLTVPEYMAEQTERTADSLAHFIGTTPEEKQTWKPTTEGAAGTRSALEQAAECAVVNRLIAGLLRGESLPMPDPNVPPLTFANGQEAQEALTSSAQELAAAIRGMSEEDLNRTYQHPRGQFLGRNLIMMCLRNMAYHAGQINLIQMLYGDTEFHVPPKWR